MTENQTVLLVVMFATVVILLFMIYREVIRNEQPALVRNAEGRLEISE